VGKINSGFPVLFNQGNWTVEGQGTEEEGDGEDSGVSGFQDRWGWVANVDGVAQTIRTDWDSVYKMPAIEFLNIICYRRDKAEQERIELEKWKKRN
jgi:hypothetical protein